ncbi:MAG: hypothetical protein ACK47C_19115 [Paracoccaceae bacterium]
MFPRDDFCYARNYGAVHLAQHPEQRVTRFSITPDFVSASPALALELRLQLRGTGGGAFAAYAVCENNGDNAIYCTMEGDAGGFQITPAKNRSILVQVSSLGMSFENEGGFTTLERNTGDDRSFILRPAACR